MKGTRIQWLAWRPTSDTAAAFLTALLMIGLYWTTTHLLSSGWSVILVFGLLTNLGLNLLFPLWWVACHRRQPLSELGLTTRHWRVSLLIGLVLALFSGIYGLQPHLDGIDWLPHLLFNATVLWEPFFIYGWLQIRFERAFGVLPGILLAALSFAAYHLGTYPLDALLAIFISGLFYAVIFRLTTNLLILWPLAWCVGSSIGTLMGGRVFNWYEVGIWTGILVISLVVVALTWLWQGRAATRDATRNG